MRYQFFLDARDYVKYGLLEDLMAQLGLPELTLIWMLTPDIDNTHGRRRPKFDDRRRALNAFFQQCPRPKLREVKGYFNRRGYKCNSYGDGPEGYVTTATRAAYFDRIGKDLLDKALIFLDPDNGVEPKSGATPLHVRLEELRLLWRRMSEESVLVIYQHKPRVSAELFWPQVSGRVAEVLEEAVLVLAFGDVGFLLVGRRDLRDLLRRAGHPVYESRTQL